MRDAFIEELTELAKEDESIFLIIGDLGFGVVDQFANEFPERFLNAGITEQSMMSIAAGIASTGYKVFVYSIANFPTFRCLEQIRNDVAYHNRDVTIVAIGAGLGYGTLGYTHHAIEDLAVLRSLPNMTVISPFDPTNSKNLLKFACSTRGPKYFRLGKNGEKDIGSNFDEVTDQFSISKNGLSEIPDLLLISTGAITENVIHAADTLKEQGVRVDVIAVSVVKPLSPKIITAASKAQNLVIIEEHSTVGGFSSAILEAAAAYGTQINPMIIGLSETTLGKYNGSQAYLREQNGLDPKSLVSRINSFLTTKNECIAN